MNLAYEYIKNFLSMAQQPALFTSFGKDSLLLMSIARAINPDITLYHFGELSDFATHYIMDNDLTVFSYAPADRYLVATDDGVSLIDEYAVNDFRIPVVREVVEGECQHGLSSQRTEAFRFPHETVLWGYRACDDVPAIGCVLDKEIVVGDSCFIAPLYEMTDAEVIEALETLGITPPNDPDNVEFCIDCINTFDMEGCRHNLAYFRERFQFSH